MGELRKRQPSLQRPRGGNQLDSLRAQKVWLEQSKRDQVLQGLLGQIKEFRMRGCVERLLGVVKASEGPAPLTLYEAPSSLIGRMDSRGWSRVGVPAGTQVDNEGEGRVWDAILYGSHRSRVTPGILASVTGGWGGGFLSWGRQGRNGVFWKVGLENQKFHFGRGSKSLLITQVVTSNRQADI